MKFADDAAKKTTCIMYFLKTKQFTLLNIMHVFVAYKTKLKSKVTSFTVLRNLL